MRPIILNWEINEYFPCSNLKELHVNLKSFKDCLYLLDGRLNELEKFYVHIDMIYPRTSTIDIKVCVFGKNFRLFSLEFI
jgi:hypothetical protein